jgi:ubiquinone/menaquinone biosynthesis C-methylase UbiE
MENSEYKIMFDLENSYWWFLGKQFLVKNMLKSLRFDRFKGERILDLGSGTGMILKVLEDYGVCCGAEISQEAISFLRKRQLNRVVCTDVNGPLPFKDNSFSLITCLDVLEHLDGDSFLLMEMARVCRPAGYIFITVPAFQSFWSPHDIALHHRRRYTKTQMLARIKGMPCQVVKASYYNMLLSIPIMVFRKMKSALSAGNQSQSDFFLSLPGILNRILTNFFKLEIAFLRYLHFPFGVSLLVVLQKRDTGGEVQAPCR